MFEFWRNWRKTDAEKRQEAMHAYLDDALLAAERQAFEKEMARDAALRQEVTSLRVLRSQLRQLPSRPVPRNFMLDPAKYGRPARQPLFQFYPALRAATVLTGLFLIVALAGGILTFTGGGVQMASDTAAVPELAQEEAAPLAEAPAVDTAVENFDAGAEADSADVERAAPAEAAEEEAEEPAAGVMAEEAPQPEAAADEETAEVMEDEALSPLPQEEAAPAGGLDDVEDGADQPAPTPTIQPTPTAQPTATAPPAIARDAQATAVPPAPTAAPAQDTAVTTATNPLPVIIIALLVVFVLLLTTTLWVRRRI